MLRNACLCWCDCRREDSSFDREPLPTEPPAKRVCTISPAPRHSPALTIPLMNPSGQFHPTPPPLQHYTLEDIATSHLYRDPSKMLEHREIRDRHGGLGESLEGSWLSFGAHQLNQLLSFGYSYPKMVDAGHVLTAESLQGVQRKQLPMGSCKQRD